MAASSKPGARLSSVSLGYQVCVHAQGDRAIEIVVDAYAYARKLAGTPGNPRSHRIERGGAMYRELTARAAELGIVVASQPGFLSAVAPGPRARSARFVQAVSRPGP